LFRKRREEFAKEIANKDRYHPSHGVPEPHVVPSTTPWLPFPNTTLLSGKATIAGK
jgi:hypothetical protein